MNIYLKIMKIAVLGVALMYCSLAVPASMQTGSEVSEAVVINIKNKITQILPGYEFITNDDHAQDDEKLRTFLSQEEYEKRKQRKYLGLIAGHFNNDTYMDYAVQIANKSVYIDHQVDSSIMRLYTVKLLVCFGGRENIIEFCEVLPTIGGSLSKIPYWKDLELVQRKSKLFQCGAPHYAVSRYFPEAWQGARPKNGMDTVPALKLKMTHDAIQEFAIGSLAGRYLYRTDDGLYLDCSDVD